MTKVKVVVIVDSQLVGVLVYVLGDGRGFCGF